MRDLVDLPKAHLHLHMEGSMRPSTLAELAEHYGVEVPAIRGYGSFPEFAGTYMAACEVLRTHDDLARVVDEVIADGAAAGAAWMEPSFYPAMYRGRFDEDEVVEVVLDALATAAARHNTPSGLMLVADRTVDSAEAVVQAQRAVRYADRGVVSFGLVNDEAPWPPAPFAEAFAVARAGGLLSTPHAGELLGPDSVRVALDALGADRVQHGVRAIEDPELVKRLADEGICCDVCPTSNVMLGVCEAVEGSALGALLDAGVPCSVNADDSLLFGPGLLEEYQLCRDALGFDDVRMAQIARSSIDASGAPGSVKAAASAAIDTWLT